MIISCHTCELVENDAIRDQKQSKISVYIQLCWVDENCWRAAVAHVLHGLCPAMSYVLGETFDVI